MQNSKENQNVGILLVHSSCFAVQLTSSVLRSLTYHAAVVCIHSPAFVYVIYSSRCNQPYCNKKMFSSVIVFIFKRVNIKHTAIASLRLFYAVFFHYSTVFPVIAVDVARQSISGRFVALFDDRHDVQSKSHVIYIRIQMIIEFLANCTKIAEIAYFLSNSSFSFCLACKLDFAVKF